MKAKHSYLIALLTLLVAACGGKKETSFDKLIAQRDSLMSEQTELNKKLEEVDDKIAKLDTTRKKLKVTAFELQPTSFSHYFDIYGNVEADENIQIYAQSSGEILSINVKEGQEVKAGQVLMRIDSEVLQRNKEQVQTQLKLANDVYEKQQRLWDKNIGTEVQFLEAKNNKESLEKQLAGINAQIDMSIIKAPFSGVIDDIFPKRGEMASPGMPLVRLVNLNSVYINADVSERYVSTVKSGTKVKVRFPELDIEIDTTVVLTGQYINPNNRTFTIRVNVPNKEGLLKPNLLARLKIEDFNADSTIVIPNGLVQQTPSGENFVYLLKPSSEGHQTKRVLIDAGMSYGNKTMVKSGIEPGDLLLNKGARSVKDGQEVQLVKG